MNILVCSIVAAALVAAMPLMAPEATAGEKFRSGLSVGSGHGYYGGRRNFGHRRHYRRGHRRNYGHRRHGSSRYFSGFSYYASPRTYYYYSPYQRAPVYYGVPVQPAPPAGTITAERTAPKSTRQSYCREFTKKIIIDGAEQLAYGTACRQPDGTWRIVP